MIQELLGGAALIAGERKISINGGGVAALVSPGASLSSSSPSPSSTTTTTTTNTSTNVAAAGSTNSENQNLRCPRCDSSNTKFCYYNNYNLTQPRHFCKTCRRYWTKGGALRNVPIGGSCRKNRNVSASNSVAKTSVAKMKTVSVAASELERSVLGVARFMDHDLPTSSPVLWGPPQNSHLLALLRASQNPNPNPSSPNVSVNGVKEEGSLMGSRTVTEPMVANGLVSGRALGFDTVGQFPTLGLCGSVWRNNNCNNNEDGTFLLGEHHQSSGIQELYQRLRSSSVNYCSDNVNSQVFIGNMVASSSSLSSSSSSLSILESAPAVAGDDQLGYTTWNPTFSWSDPPTTNGTAYP